VTTLRPNTPCYRSARPVPRFHRDVLLLLAWAGAAAAITVVFGLVVVPAIWSLATPAAPPGAHGAPPFALVDPIGPTRCSADAVPTVGCLAAGDYVYRLTPEFSSTLFGGVYCLVERSNGTNYSVPNDGGFDILNGSGAAVAAFNLSTAGPLAMSSPSEWVYFTSSTGVTAETSLTSIYTIVVDLGSVNPEGAGYSVVAVLTGPHAGNITAVGLP
jgi:hypothetical protein